jgi:chromate transporter
VSAFVAIFAFRVPFPLIVVGAALSGWLSAKQLHVVPQPHASSGDVSRTVRTIGVWLAIWLGPVALLVLALGPGHIFSTLALFFSRVAVVTFGGAYAVLAYVAQAAVETHHWLEMLDGLGLAETTPGPLIIVVQFVAFLGAYRLAGDMNPILAGVIGSIVTVWVTFAPSFLFIFAGAPWIERLTANPRLSAMLAAITAAVVGVVLNLGVWFAIHTLFGTVATRSVGWMSLPVPVPTSFSPVVAAIALLAAVALFRFRIGLLWVLGGGAALGVVARMAGLA